MFHWFVRQVAQIIARAVTLGNVEKKIVAEMPQSFPKVEPSSTSCDVCGNEKIARNVCCGVCYKRQFFMQLVSQPNCKTSCKKGMVALFGSKWLTSL